MPAPSAPARGRTFAPPLRKGILAILAFAILAAGGGGWFFSDALIRPIPVEPLEAGLAVVALDDSTITLAGSSLARRGHTWFLDWPGGSGILGEPVELSGGDTPRRRFRLLAGRLVPGDRVALSPFLVDGDPLRSLDLPFQTVPVAGELGAFPAWFIPGPRSTWAVIVHGMNAGRGEALRLLPVFHRQGMPSLTLTYRNDAGAPRGPDGLHHLGATEWRDLEAGVRHAIDHGARQVVLVGFSMGGALTAEFLRRSPLADAVAGIVLDAPTLDWGEIVDHGARTRGGPAPLLAPLARQIVTLRTGFRWSDTGPSVWARQFGRPHPVLVFHGTADDLVPIAVSEAFVESLGGRATLVATAGADHVQSWNYQAGRYEAALSGWLAAMVRDLS